MTDVFISYSHEDQEFVRKLVHAFEAEGVSVWWDHSIPPGQTWETHITRHIEAAKACIVVWSPVSAASDWVKEEATVAQQAGKFLPIRTQDAVQPPMGFRRIQAVSFENWTGDRRHSGWLLLLGEVRRLMRGEPQIVQPAAAAPAAPTPTPPQAPTTPPPAAPTKKKLPIAWIAGIGGGIAALLLVGVLVANNNSTTEYDYPEIAVEAPADPAAAPAIPDPTTLPEGFTVEAVIDVLRGDQSRLIGAFVWDATPQGHEYWSAFHQGRQLTPEAHATLLGWFRLYERTYGPVVPTGVGGTFPEGFNIESARAVLAGDTSQLISAFVWGTTEHGHAYWQAYHGRSLTPEARAALQDFVNRYESGERGPD